MNRFNLFLHTLINKGFFHLLSANFLIKLVTFASGLIVAGVLTPSDIGVIRILQVYLGLFVLISGLGFNTSTLKLVSEGVSRIKKTEYLSSAIVVSLISSLFVYGIAFVIAKLELLTSEEKVNFLLPFIAVSIPILTLNNLFNVYLQGVKEIKKMSYVQIITKIISVIFILFLSYLFSINGYVVGFLTGVLITFIFYIIFLKNNIKINVINLNKNIKKHWTLARFAFLANLIGSLSASLDLLMLNLHTFDREIIGFYSFATTLALVLELLTGTIQQISFPYFSEKSNNTNLWFQTLKKYSKLNILTAVFLFIIANTIGIYFLKIVFNHKYDNSIFFFRMLTIVWLLRNFYMLNGIAIMGKGLFNVNFINSFIAIVVDVIFVYFGIKFLGVVGATYGLIPGQIVRFIISFIAVNRIRYGKKVYYIDSSN